MAITKEASAQYFNEVYTPTFINKLAQLGVFVKDERDLGNLMKLAGQLKLAGVKSSIDQRSDVYEHLTNVMGKAISKKG